LSAVYVRIYIPVYVTYMDSVSDSLHLGWKIQQISMFDENQVYLAVKLNLVQIQFIYEDIL